MLSTTNDKFNNILRLFIHLRYIMNAILCRLSLCCDLCTGENGKAKKMTFHFLFQSEANTVLFNDKQFSIFASPPFGIQMLRMLTYYSRRWKLVERRGVMEGNSCALKLPISMNLKLLIETV